MKSALYVEYQGRQLNEKDIIADAKKIWTNSGKKASDLTSLKIYIKPEDNMAYYVFNDDITGSFDLDKYNTAQQD